MMNKTTLKLMNVNKTFVEAGNFEVLKNINLSAEEGEFICVLGPSGCGKSILLYLIAGFIKGTSGDILMNNKQIDSSGIDRMMVFQDYILFPWKTVYDNILFGLSKVKMSSGAKKDLVMKYLDLVGLTHFKNWHVHKLSGGMQQRIAIARALVVDPKVLLMDEPFSALDSQHRKFLRQKLVEIWQKTKKTIIFVTHSVSEAMFLADKIYFLSSRPATVKKVYQIKFTRPRDLTSTDFIALKKEIETEMAVEFKKTMKKQMRDKPSEEYLKINL